jgi:hypothetical protein
MLDAVHKRTGRSCPLELFIASRNKAKSGKKIIADFDDSKSVVSCSSFNSQDRKTMDLLDGLNMYNSLGTSWLLLLGPCFRALSKGL